MNPQKRRQRGNDYDAKRTTQEKGTSWLLSQSCFQFSLVNDVALAYLTDYMEFRKKYMTLSLRFFLPHGKIILPKQKLHKQKILYFNIKFCSTKKYAASVLCLLYMM